MKKQKKIPSKLRSFKSLKICTFLIWTTKLALFLSLCLLNEIFNEYVSSACNICTTRVTQFIGVYCNLLVLYYIASQCFNALQFTTMLLVIWSYTPRRILKYLRLLSIIAFLMIYHCWFWDLSKLKTVWRGTVTKQIIKKNARTTKAFSLALIVSSVLKLDHVSFVTWN